MLIDNRQGLVRWRHRGGVLLGFGLLALIGVSLCPRPAAAATLVSWDFSSLDYMGSNNQPVPNPVLTPGSGNVIAGLTVSDLTSSGLQTSNGSQIPGEGNYKNFDVGGDGNDNYLEFTIGLDTATSFDIDSISISQWRNGGGAPNGVAFDVSVDGGPFTLYDAVQVDSDSGVATFETFTFIQAIAGATEATIRYTPRNAGAGNTGNLHVNGLTVDGTVTSVPEPSTLLLAVLGLLGLAVVGIRKVRRR